MTGQAPAYRLVRSKRRTLALEMARDGSLTVRAPMRTPQADIDRFVSSHLAWIGKHRAALPPPKPAPTAEEIAALRRRAEEEIPRRVAYYSALMGLTPKSVKITSAKKRFGSCSPQNGLCFSLYLMAYPDEAINYVVVHELAHIRYHNHGAAFHELVRQYLPDEEKRIRMLR